jgi:D-xylose 1-dehydrogenase (NADP+, D-xylono-1,5-lactone-forming)
MPREYAAVTRIRLGLLSTAGINAAILGARADDAPFAIVAVGSRDASRAEAYAHEHDIERAHGSYDDLLDDDGIDAVYVALPNVFHHEWTMRALAAGKHVLVEKPYTRVPEEVDEAWDEAERRGLVLTEAYMWRHANQTRLLRELLPRIGELQAARASFFGILPRDDDVRFVPELGGGALLDLGCYCVSACRLVLGEPGRVYGEAWLGRGGVDERFAGTLRFGNVVATFECGFTATLNQIEVVGAGGVLSVPQAFVNPPGVVVLNGETHRVEPGDHYRAELDDFCAAIRGERAVLNGRAEMLGQARVLAALLDSADGGSPVAV